MDGGGYSLAMALALEPPPFITTWASDSSFSGETGEGPHDAKYCSDVTVMVAMGVECSIRDSYCGLDGVADAWRAASCAWYACAM